MAKGWTKERREKQAQRIRENKPWEKSTGPRTEKGKRRASMNAYKHGMSSAKMRGFHKWLALNREFVRMAEIILSHDEGGLCSRNELIEYATKSSDYLKKQRNE